MKMSFKVSQSKIKVWRHCRKQYDYKYVQELTKKYKPMPFLRGTIIHDMLEAHYTNKDPWKVFKAHIKENEKLLRTHVEEYGDLENNLKILMTGYFDYYEDEDITPISVEGEFETPLTKGIILTGKRDMIAKHQKMKWMMEHKGHNTIPNDGIVPYANIQTGLYVWSYNKENKKPLEGILWNYLWCKPLTIPQLLKDGTMSMKAINTTWTMYKKELIKNKLNPKDYEEMKEKLEGQEDLIYQRKLVPINMDMIEKIVDETIITAKEMEKLGGVDTTRNLGYDCDRCEFRELCMAQLKGLDYNYILKANFKKREKDDGHKKVRQKN